MKAKFSLYCLVLCVQEGFLQSCLAPGLKPFCLILFMEICLYWMCTATTTSCFKILFDDLPWWQERTKPHKLSSGLHMCHICGIRAMNRNIHILHTKLTTNAVWFFETWFLGSLDCPSTSSLFVDQLTSHSQRSAYKCSFLNYFLKK